MIYFPVIIYGLFPSKLKAWISKHFCKILHEFVAEDLELKQ